jgi:ABC-2 type transport system permease protein
LLVTSPVHVREIVWGKFLGVSAIVMIMMLMIFMFPALLCIFGNPEIAPILSGLLAVSLCTLGFVSVGMAVSSFTENQIVAAVSSMVTLLLLYVIHSPAESLGGVPAAVLNYLSPVMQARDMLRGVITLSSCVYFLSLISFGLFMSERALEAYRWR